MVGQSGCCVACVPRPQILPAVLEKQLSLWVFTIGSCACGTQVAAERQALALLMSNTLSELEVFRKVTATPALHRPSLPHVAVLSLCFAAPGLASGLCLYAFVASGPAWMPGVGRGRGQARVRAAGPELPSMQANTPAKHCAKRPTLIL